MAMDHIVKHTCRFNIKNPQHRRVNEILSKLSPEVCKSKSQFMITATEYYIDHFGEEAFVSAPKDNSAYVTKAELEELKQQMIDAAVMAAKDEIIRISLSGKGEPGISVPMAQQPMEKTEQAEEDDEDVLGYALSYMPDMEE